MPNCLTLKKFNCKNCYKCIRHCPVKSIRFSGSQAHIIGNEYILCGQCFVVCPQNAKEIVDNYDGVGMACVSGCIGGAGNLTHGEKNRAAVDNYGREALEKTIMGAIGPLETTRSH